MLCPIDRRIEKIRKKINEKGIDVLILTNVSKISYVSKTHHSGWNSGNCVFIWAEGDPTLLTRVTERPRLIFEENSVIKDVQYWNLPLQNLKPISWGEKCIEILKNRGVEKGIIAVEESGISWLFYTKLKEELSKANFIDGEELINNVMRAHDEEELSLMQRASAMTDAALEAVIEAAQVGVTETQLAGIAEKTMRDLGCEDFYSPTQVNFDNRVYGDHVPTERILQRGNKIQLDSHPVYKFYRGDYFREMILGKPNKEYKRAAEVCTKAAHNMIKSLVPGASTKEIALAFYDEIKSAGYTNKAQREIGHGIGTTHLPPLICCGLDWKLMENEVISISPYINELGNFTFLMEFCVKVAKGGGVPLNTYPLGLIVIDK